MNINTIIAQHAARDPAKILIAVDADSCTYGAFAGDTDTIAGGLLRLGCRPGQKIAMIIPNSIAWYEIFWAIVKTGAQPVPLDPQIGAWEMERLLALLEIEVCFIAAVYRANKISANLEQARKNLPLLKCVIDIAGLAAFQGESPTSAQTPDSGSLPETLMYACTSGSTGNPKVIVVPYRGFYQAQHDMASYLGFTRDDVMLLGMPLYHQGGFGMGLQMVLTGGTVIYQPVFDPQRFLNTIRTQKVTVIQLTATLAKILLSVPEFDSYDLSGVRMSYFAGEVLPMDIARIFFEKLGIRVVNIIGSSETATMVVWDSEHDRDADVNDFRTLPFTRMQILDADLAAVAVNATGNLHIHTDALITAYYKNPAETALRLATRDGVRWFDTGDLGTRLPDGRIRFAGRAKRIIKRGSNLVYPEEIEAYLLTHPDIAAVAVTGEAHELIGEMIVAHIQPRQGVSLSRGDIIRFCKGKLAAYKLPDQVNITTAIPHDIGKVQYKYLK